MNFSRNKTNGRAPTTVFTTATMSPRQIATKAYSLACKKLDRDDRRSRPRYTIRERLLLCNTINKAEDLLNKRTQRFNRRVLSMEEDESLSSEDNIESQHAHTSKPAIPGTAVHTSSLRPSTEESEDFSESIAMPLSECQPSCQAEQMQIPSQTLSGTTVEWIQTEQAESSTVTTTTTTTTTTATSTATSTMVAAGVPPSSPVFTILSSGHLEQLIALSESVADTLISRDCRLISHRLLSTPMAAAII